MKKYILILIILFSFFQTNQLHSQSRPFLQPIAADDDDGAAIGGGENPVVNTFGQPICCEGGDGLDFTITYNSMSVLLAMQDALASVNNYIVQKWLEKQENNFLKEINKQLGKNHSNFSVAQKDFFKNFEQYLGAETQTSQLSINQYAKSGRANTAQKLSTSELFYIDKWEKNTWFCQQFGYKDFCQTLSALQIKGIALGNASPSSLADIKTQVVSDFSALEIEWASSNSLGNGLNKIIEDGSLLNDLSEKHVNNYKNKGLRDKIFLMTSYLITYNNRGGSPLTSPIARYNIPRFWDDNVLTEMGKKKASKLELESLVFSAEWVNNILRLQSQGLGPYPGVPVGTVAQRFKETRDKVIQRHLEDFSFLEEFFKQKKPDYVGQRVLTPKRQYTGIHENAFAIENSRGETIAFITPDEKVFYWNSKIGGYSLNESSDQYRDSYMSYVEDKYMRQSEPISWGIYLAADDLGGFILDLVDHPNETISDFATGLKKIITLDFNLEKTWEAILDADLTDASYLSATLAMGHMAGPKGAGLVSAADTGAFQQFLAKYAVKNRPKKLKWPEVLALFKKARLFEKAISDYLPSIYWPSKGFKVFNQVYVKYKGTVSIVDNLIYNKNSGKWILNETKYGTSNVLSKNQQIIQDAIKSGKAIEIRSANPLRNADGSIAASQGDFIFVDEILRSHSSIGQIIHMATVRTIWKK